MDTYERTYSSHLPAQQASDTACVDDAAIAQALAEAEPALSPRPDTSLDSALALQLHEQEAQKLVQPRRRHRVRKRADSALRSLLRTLNVAKVIPRINPCFEPDADYVSADRQRLLLRLDLYGLEERVVQGDGNCMFRAVADQLWRDQGRHGEVRQRVVRQLLEQPGRYRDYVTSDYEQYVSSMATAGTWGDHVSLQAASDAYDARIVVVTSFMEDCVISITPEREQQQQQLKEEQQKQQQQQEQAGQQQDPPGSAGRSSLDGGSGADNAIWLSFWAEVHYNSLCAKPPASVSSEESSEDDPAGGSPADGAGRKGLARRLGDMLRH